MSGAGYGTNSCSGPGGWGSGSVNVDTGGWAEPYKVPENFIWFIGSKNQCRKKERSRKLSNLRSSAQAALSGLLLKLPSRVWTISCRGCALYAGKV